MTMLPEVLALLAWLLLCACAPGAAAVGLLRGSLEGRAERAMVVVAVSVTLLGAVVFGLLFLGLYERWITLALLAACGVYLSWLATRHDPRWLALWAQPTRRDPTPTSLDGPMLALCAVTLALAFAGALVSPATWWDAAIHWDKWAADWGRRSDLHNYPYAYPQVLPMFTSLAYKLAGQGGLLLPSAAFAVHALHPLFGLLLLLALVRLAAVLGLPRWALLLAVFGSRTVREHLVAGGVDLFLTAMTAVAAAFALTVLRDPERGTPGRWRLVTLLLAGALAIKPTGAMASAVVLATCAAWHVWPPAGSALVPWSRSMLSRLALVPVLLVTPFYAWAWYADVTYDLARLDPRELHYLFVEMGPILARATAVARPTAVDATQVLLETLYRPVADYGFPRAWLVPVLALVLGLLAAATRDRRTRGLVLPVLAYLVVWTKILSYDVRNLIPALPFLGLALVCGAQHLRARATRSAARRALGAVMVMAVAYPLWGLLADMGRSGASLIKGPLSWSQRWRALESDLDTKVATFFADQWPDYAFIKDMGLDQRARHVVASGPLYRLFTNGVYPLSLFWWGHLQPGDLYVHYYWIEPGPAQIDDWFLVRTSTGCCKTYVYGPQAKRVPLDQLLATGPRPQPARAALTQRLVQFTGPESLVAYDVLAERPPPGASVLWQLVAEERTPDPRIRPVVLAQDPTRVDWSRTSFMVDDRAGAGLTYSGIVTLTRESNPGDWRASLLVGAASEEAGPRLHVRGFRVWVRSAPSASEHAAEHRVTARP
jgi:hypothetical protein